MAGSSEQGSASWRYRAGAGVAFLASFLIAWATIVHDDGAGIGFFLVIIAAWVGAFAAWFRPAGMARTMLGVAIMQALLGLAIATAPLTANTPDGPIKALLFNGFFTALWSISAIFFHGAAKNSHRVAAAQ